MSDRDTRPQVATEADATTVVTTLAAAFAADPLWSWAFPDPDKRADQLATWLGFFVESALPNGWVWISGSGEATSVWTPPGKAELNAEAAAKIEPFLAAELGAHAEAVLQVLMRFEALSPDDQGFYYLSFLGTHPEHRGHGIGMSLLEANLTHVDADGMPAYLESSNPANNARYERLGFKPRSGFETQTESTRLRPCGARPAEATPDQSVQPGAISRDRAGGGDPPPSASARRGQSCRLG
jgi:GNAT superfamily N-acetyltransferase